MKFIIKRTSQEYRQEQQPHPKAVEVSREHIIRRYSNTGATPPEWELKYWEYRDGDYWDEYDMLKWEIEINTLEELVALANETGSGIIVEDGVLEIYDDYHS